MKIVIFKKITVILIKNINIYYINNYDNNNNCTTSNDSNKSI